MAVGSRPQRRARSARRRQSGIRIDGGAAAGGGGRGPGLGPGRQGAEDRRARASSPTSSSASRRRRRATAWPRRSGSSSGWPASACSRRRSSWCAFVPMLFIARAYYYMNRADPGLRHHLLVGHRAMGPYAGWIGGWAIIVADIIVMANLAQIAGLYTLPALRLADAPRTRRSAVTIVGVVWIAIMTAICVYRHRAVGAHPGRPARRRADHAGASSPSSPWSRSTPATPARLGRPEPLVAEPVPGRQLERARRRGAAGGLHLLGLGQHRHRQRGERGLQRDARARPRSSAPSSCSATYVDRGGRRAGLQRPPGPHRSLRRHLQRARHRGPRLAAGQAADHRGAHLGGGVDPDDDPADRAHVAVDGAGAARCRSRWRASTRAS